MATKDKTTGEDSVVSEAKKRYETGISFEDHNRKEGIDDLKMIAGQNHWPEKTETERKLEGRPCLTVNKLAAFTDQVKNDSRMNQLAIKVFPYGGGATKKSAELMQGIIRGIENNSDAQIAYQNALDGAADCGFGFFRIDTEWPEDEVWEQEIKIRPIRNQFSVIIDPGCKEFDTRDKKWAIISEMIARQDFKDEYGTDPVPFTAQSDQEWATEDTVRIAEYWVMKPITKEIVLLSDGRTVDADKWAQIEDDLKAGEKMIHLEPNPDGPDLPPIEVEGPAPEGSGWPEAVLNPTPTVVRRRKVNTHKVIQYIIDGQRVLDTKEWPGKWIPIIPIWGKELNIDGKVYRRGVIRFAKDPQRMYDYFRTAATETVALAPKAPWLAEYRQIQDFADDWDNANSSNISVLRYKHIAGVTPPTRNVVTQTALGEITEANISDQEMKATTSMFAPALGEPSNEISGRAINARKIEGDVANFTYHDNKRRALKFAGDILVDLIPKIFDTERQVLHINDKDEDELVTINQVVRDAATLTDVIVNDLTFGKYRVAVDAGPSFLTQREEATASMMDFVRTAPETAKFVLDLVAESANWPGAAKIAARLKKLLPPGIDDEGPLPPAPPSPDDINKQLKNESIQLGNELKKVKLVGDVREIDDTHQRVAEAGAKGAMMAFGLTGQEE